MCIVCNLLDRTFSLPSARELVRHVGEAGITDAHKNVVYDLALDKANELNLDPLEYTADLASAIQRDLLRKT